MPTREQFLANLGGGSSPSLMEDMQAFSASFGAVLAEVHAYLVSGWVGGGVGAGGVVVRGGSGLGPGSVSAWQGRAGTVRLSSALRPPPPLSRVRTDTCTRPLSRGPRTERNGTGRRLRLAAQMQL